jgi:RNA polymerase sigma-70 factor (ECF subfamily)
MVRDAFLAGRHAWPGVKHDEGEFRAWVLAQGIDDAALEKNGADLFLASACAAGKETAVAAFESLFIRGIRPTLGRVILNPELLDELRQALRVRLLIGPAPRIVQYRGTGPLGTWVRVAAARLALKLKTASDRRSTSDAVVLDALVAAGTDPELASAKTQHREMFCTELERCFENLEPREKTLLRMHFLHDMSIDEMGTILRVHRATVARWLVALRRQILASLSKRLSLHIRSGSEVNSLIRLVRSDVEISVRRLLGGSTSGT